MKISKIILALFFISISFTQSFAQADELFSEANQQYQNKQFIEAIASYNKIVDNGYESPVLFYNLANAYFRINKIGYAILNYEKALKLAPGDEDIIYNLKLANARQQDKIKEVPQIFIVQWWDEFVTMFTIDGWAVITLIFYFVIMGSIVLYIFTRSRSVSRLTFISGSAGFAAFVIWAIILFSAVNRESTREFGVLLTEVQSVKVSPDAGSNDAFVIHEGVKFTVNDKVGDWVKIKLADGKVGWLPSNTFGLI